MSGIIRASWSTLLLSERSAATVSTRTFDFCAIADFVCGQRLGAARHDDHVAAFAGENFGGGAADALRAAGDQRRFAGKLQIHDVPRKN